MVFAGWWQSLGSWLLKPHLCYWQRRTTEEEGGEGMFGGSERKERNGCSQGGHTEVLPQVSVTEVDARDRMRWAQMIRWATATSKKKKLFYLLSHSRWRCNLKQFSTVSFSAIYTRIFEKANIYHLQKFKCLKSFKKHVYLGNTSVHLCGLIYFLRSCPLWQPLIKKRVA